LRPSLSGPRPRVKAGLHPGWCGPPSSTSSPTTSLVVESETRKPAAVAGFREAV
jgi:hypothetical protein